MQEHLGKPIDSLVKLVIRHWSVLEWKLMRDHKRRLSTTADDEVSEVAVVCLHVALTGSKVQALLEHCKQSVSTSETGTCERERGLTLSEAEQNLTFAALLVGRAWVGRDVESRN